MSRTNQSQGSFIVLSIFLKTFLLLTCSIQYIFRISIVEPHLCCFKFFCIIGNIVQHSLPYWRYYIAIQHSFFLTKFFFILIFCLVTERHLLLFSNTLFGYIFQLQSSKVGLSLLLRFYLLTVNS